jgi:plastocyanin
MKIVFAGAICALAFVAEAGAAETNVVIGSFAFTPKTLTVSRGAKVVFLNHDEAPHNIVDAKGAFRSPPLETGARYERIFDAPGEIAYFCALHPQMTGKIVVTP